MIVTLSCASICFLSLSLNYHSSPDIRKCTYCVQQLLHHKLTTAAEGNDSVLYCLVRNEHPWGRELPKRSTHCISHADLLSSNRSFLLPALAFLPVSDHRRQCANANARQRNCHCSDCPNGDLTSQLVRHEDNLISGGKEESEIQKNMQQNTKNRAKETTTPYVDTDASSLSAFSSSISPSLAPIAVTFRARFARPIRSQRKMARKSSRAVGRPAPLSPNSADHSNAKISLETISTSFALLFICYFVTFKNAF